jgi:hypothetical protein
MNGSLQLSEYPFDMVRLPCGKCGRAGQYRKQTLLNTTVPIFDCLIGGRKLRSANVMGKHTMPAWLVMWIWSLRPGLAASNRQRGRASAG